MNRNRDTDGLSIRCANPTDIPRILNSIKSLAEYERRPQDVLATEADLDHWLFKEKLAEVLLADYEGMPAGYALFYPTFSSFSAVGHLHLDDLFIVPSLRGKGLGKHLLKKVAAIAMERGYDRMEWSCLDWNQASIDFYKKIGATTESGRIHFEFRKENIQDFIADETR